MRTCTGSQVLNPPSENSPAMAMPDLVQNVAESFLELTPGVPANQRNLKTLLAKVLDRNWLWMSNEMFAMITKEGSKKKPMLLAKLCGKTPNSFWSSDDRLVEDMFPATEDGLLKAIVFLKRSIHKYRSEGTCEACEPPNKRLKADGMPKCEDCMLSAAMGI